MNQTVKTVLWLIIIILVIWGGWVIWQKRDAAPAGEPIILGFIGPLTGDAANIGQNARAATEISVAEINAEGGIGGRPLEVIYEDGKCSGKDAMNAANKLINIDKVPVILGGACSSETAAFAGLAEQTQTVTFSYCSTAPSISDAGDYIFRNVPSDAYQGSFVADYLYNTLGKSKVAILYVRADWGVGIDEVFVPKFEELGGTVVANEGYEQTSRDLRAQLTKIKAANPDLLFFIGYTEASIPGLKQAQELGLDVPIFGADAWDDATIWSEVGTAGEGVMYIIPYSPLDEHFKQAMLEKLGSDEITICSPNAYDAVKILGQVISDVGTDSTAIKDALYQVVYTGGVSSDEIRFDDNGDLVGASYIVKVAKDGVAVPVETDLENNEAPPEEEAAEE